MTRGARSASRTGALGRVARCGLAALLALGTGRAALAHGSHAGVIRGAVTFQVLCASCHGPQGRGDGPRAADGLARPSDLTRIADRHGGRFDRREVAAWIDGRTRIDAHGTAETPVWGEQGLRLSASQGGDEDVSPRMKELLDYLEHMQTDR